MTSKNNFFRRHWILSIIITWTFIIGMSELALRIVDPQIFDYVYSGRRIFKYSTSWRVDLEPGITAHLRLGKYDGENLYNFLVTTNDFGFRTYDREIDGNYIYGEESKEDNADATHFIHAIGDSFTMGWGGDYTSSYPSILDWILPVNYRVLNLGIAGFGAVAATEKSKSLWDRYPAVHVIYLFCPYNDFSDDEIIIRRRQPAYKIYHMLRHIYSFIRKYSYLSNIPYVIETHRTYYRARNSSDYSYGKVISRDKVKYEDIIINDPPPVLVDNADHPTFTQISAYADFLREHNGGFTVLLMDTGPESAKMYSFCKSKAIDVHMLSIPKEMKLLQDGHFNFAGNFLIAEFLRNRILNDSFFRKHDSGDISIKHHLDQTK